MTDITHYTAGLGKARSGMAWRGKARLGGAWRGLARQGKARAQGFKALCIICKMGFT